MNNNELQNEINAALNDLRISLKHLYQLYQDNGNFAGSIENQSFNEALDDTVHQFEKQYQLESESDRHLIHKIKSISDCQSFSYKKIVELNQDERTLIEHWLNVLNHEYNNRK